MWSAMSVEMAETASPLRVLEFYSGIGGLVSYLFQLSIVSRARV